MEQVSVRTGKCEKKTGRVQAMEKQDLISDPCGHCRDHPDPETHTIKRYVSFKSAVENHMFYQ